MRTRWMLAPFALATLAASVACASSDPAPTGQPPGSAASQAATDTAQAETSAAQPANGDGSEVRYLALGDSLSQGVGAPDEATGAFPALLAENWRIDGCPVELQNAGISGYTAGQVLSEQVPQIADFQPTLITFQAGGNDLANGVSADQYRSDVQAVLDAATGSGARVIVLAMNDWWRSPSGQGYTTQEAVTEFDDIMIEEAQSRGAQFVDMRSIYKQQADDNQWVEDGLHPTPEAYEQWATELASQVPAPCR